LFFFVYVFFCYVSCSQIGLMYIRHLSSFQEHTPTFTMKSTTEEDKITKCYYKRDDCNLLTVNLLFSSSNILTVYKVHPLQLKCLLGLVSTTVIFWIRFSCWHKCYSNKAVFLGWGHFYQIYTVVVTKWLTVTKYPFLKWQFDVSTVT
jgi:hypothetical protein